LEIGKAPLLPYIRGANDPDLTVDGECGKLVILGYPDGDWGPDLDTRRSTTGYVFET
jgi:hypothetical protein